MPCRNVPTNFLYSFGLTVNISMIFNGILLNEQTRQRSIDEYESGNVVNPANFLVWQQQRSDFKRSKQQKDSRIGGPTDSPTWVGIKCTLGAVTIQPTSPK